MVGVGVGRGNMGRGKGERGKGGKEERRKMNRECGMYVVCSM